MVLFRVVHLDLQPDSLAQTSQPGLKPAWPVADGEFSFSENQIQQVGWQVFAWKTKYNRPDWTPPLSRHKSCQIKPNLDEIRQDPTRFWRDPLKFGQILMRSVKIWQDFNKILRDLARFQQDLLRSLPPPVSRFPPLRSINLNQKQFTANSNWNRLDLWFSVVGCGTNPTREQS